MKLLLIISTIALLSVSCGRRIQQITVLGSQGPAGVNGTNGNDGVNGQDGVDSSSEKVTIVQICPSNNSRNTTFLETLLKVEQANDEGIQYMAFFDATKRRLVELTPNTNFVTTDDRSQPFYINSLGEIVCHSL